MTDENRPPPVVVKDQSTTTLQCPMLTETNYNIWAIRIKAVFKVHGIQQALEPGKKEVDAKKDDMAVALLLQAIPEELVFQVAQFQTTKEIWEALKTRISQLVTKAASLGTTYENRKLTRKLLGSVPAKYVPIVASIQQFADLKAMTFQEAVGRLKTFEDKIKGIESLAENQGNLMFANGESSSKSKSYENTRGHGRGDSSYRGRRQDWDDEDQDGSQSRDGQDHGSKQTGQRRTNDHQKGRKDRSRIQCYRCDKFGHFASGCPDRMKKQSEANLAKNDDFDPSLFMMR
ncbi:uncharacterized protein LOC118488904 [Helianthus annuus]|uniref:uncharacterized protein LOC118488904 n=1 Tax=Helianthus annuus TaxID=4232 RepID=UPI001652FEE8|nr:uncharacterized protein LOC118488904 [Helianthus annuus]